MNKAGPAENTLTPRMRECLEWASGVGEFSMWPIAMAQIMRRARLAGYVEATGRAEPGVMGLQLYRLSAAGRAAPMSGGGLEPVAEPSGLLRQPGPVLRGRGDPAPAPQPPPPPL